jgi:Na+-driven multidrug efflux pump
MMLEQPVARVIRRSLFPMIVAMLIDAIYNFNRYVLCQPAGYAATAAVGVNASLMHLMRSVALAFGVGASSTISRLLGGKKDAYASRVASTTLITGDGRHLPAGCGRGHLVGPLVLLLGATGVGQALLNAVCTLVSARFAVYSRTVVLSQLLRARVPPAIRCWAWFQAASLNIALDPLFIYGLDLGVAARPWRTACPNCSASVCCLYFPAPQALLELSLKLFTPKKRSSSVSGESGYDLFCGWHAHVVLDRDQQCRRPIQ